VGVHKHEAIARFHHLRLATLQNRLEGVEKGLVAHQKGHGARERHSVFREPHDGAVTGAALQQTGLGQTSYGAADSLAVDPQLTRQFALRRQPRALGIETGADPVLKNAVRVDFVQRG